MILLAMIVGIPAAGIFAVGTLGFSMMSDASRERAETEARAEEMAALLGILEWHFAMSYEWEPFTFTVRASDLEAAFTAVDQRILDEGGDPYDEWFRTYAVIRGGRNAVDLGNTKIPLASKVHLVFQGGIGIEIATFESTEFAMNKEEIEDLAWKAKISPDMKKFAKGAGGEFVSDLIVIGGTVVHVSDL